MDGGKIAVRPRRGRGIVLGFVAAAIVLTTLPIWLRDRFARDLCPSEVTASGTSDGVVWEVTRADCGGGRVVGQLRIVPPKGVSTLVYSAEGGPAPVDWRQSGLTGRLELAAPIDGVTTLEVPLDPKGRPIEPIEISQGRRIR